jgi:hypothetical protein
MYVCMYVYVGERRGEEGGAGAHPAAGDDDSGADGVRRSRGRGSGQPLGTLASNLTLSQP